MRTSDRVTPGSLADRSVTGFRLRHRMSRSKYYSLKNQGRGPKETEFGPKSIIITEKDEADWDRANARPGATEQRLRARVAAKRVAIAKKAAAASAKSERHVSKQNRRSR